MSHLLGTPLWRTRLIALLALFVVALTLNPLTTHSDEPNPITPAASEPNLVRPSSPGPYRLVNASYRPGRQALVGMVGQALRQAIRVRVEDSRGKPVAGVPVNFEFVATPKKAADAQLTSRAVTGPDGIAAADLRFGAQAGTYLVAARTDGMSGAMPHITAKSLKATWWVFVVFGILGGLGMFLFGMELGSGGLQKVAGNRMRQILGQLTTNRFMGVALGTIVTGIVQSSTATTVMVVGFASASLMTLTQALGVIMGANIGTTLTVQLIAFQISDFALFMIGAGVVLTLITKRKTYIYIGEIILGFGMIFYGMSIMAGAVAPLRSMPIFSDTLLTLGQRPFLGIFIAAVLTAIMHSGAVIGLVVVLASEGLIDLNSAMPIIFGANIGTTFTALIATIGASTEGKRTGLAHFLFNVLGVVIFFPFLTWYIPAVKDFTHWMGSSSVAREVANGHMIFNVIATLIFLPFVRPWAWLVEKLIPVKEKPEEEAFKPRYLNNDFLETPDLALTSAYREVCRVAHLVGDMLGQTVQAFDDDGGEAAQKLEQRAQEVNALTDELRRYYIRLSQKNLGLMQSREKHGHVSIVDDLRQISHFIGGDVVEMATSLREEGAKFSEQGRQELLEYQSFAVSVHTATEEAMRERDTEKARIVRSRKDEGEQYERRLRDAHLARLDAGLSESAETSTAHMDLLSGMRQIGRHDFRICRTLEEFLTTPS